MLEPRNFWMRWRVRAGYPVAVLFWIFARPSYNSIIVGGAIAAIGLVIRAIAAGHLQKNRELATSGLYAYTRNPLYLGSSLLAVGFAVTGSSWADGALVIGYFAVFYYAVIRNEEADLRRRFGPAFDEYSANVPLFLPQFALPQSGVWKTLPPPTKTFSWALYRRNREYNALIGTLIGIGLLWVRMWLHGHWVR
ncbi:MAG TPA: isoprenylcysteine carboxylmethyltransferase family protein [Candidatus Dormibacteraeota bacterium]|nr:isoprenylcysteine carboxylmethyltransferase family protein [Candidatus Dormibacteraeota bacterium]